MEDVCNFPMDAEDVRKKCTLKGCVKEFELHSVDAGMSKVVKVYDMDRMALSAVSADATNLWDFGCALHTLHMLHMLHMLHISRSCGRDVRVGEGVQVRADKRR